MPSRVLRASTARLFEEHQRQQPDRLGLVGHQVDQQPAETDSLLGQLLADQPFTRASGVALVEDQVDDGENGREAVRQVGLFGDPVGDTGVSDLALGPHQSLGHRRLGDQERVRDLGCASARRAAAA